MDIIDVSDNVRVIHPHKRCASVPSARKYEVLYANTQSMMLSVPPLQSYRTAAAHNSCCSRHKLLVIMLGGDVVVNYKGDGVYLVQLNT